MTKNPRPETIKSLPDIPSGKPKSKPKHIRKAIKRKQIWLSKYRRGKITIEDFILAHYFPAPLFYIGHIDGPPPFCDVYFRADTNECITLY